MVLPWIIPSALAAALLLLFVRALGPRLFGGTVTWGYGFRCPLKEQEVATEFRESAWDGQRLDVERCSAGCRSRPCGFARWVSCARAGGSGRARPSGDDGSDSRTGAGAYPPSGEQPDRRQARA
jgi:hypothetical protein